MKRYSGALFGPLDVGSMGCRKTSSDLYTVNLYRQRLTFKTYALNLLVPGILR